MTPGERRDVDVVEADREVAHHLELRPRGVEQLVVDPVGEEREQAFDPTHPAQKLVARWRQLVVPEVDLARLAEGVQAGIGDEPGDEHAWLHAGGSATYSRGESGWAIAAANRPSTATSLGRRVA